MKTNAQNAQRQHNITAARERGRQACLEGRPAAPALDEGFMEILARHAGQGHGALEVLTAWTTAWHTENVAAPVYLPDGSVLQLPK